MEGWYKRFLGGIQNLGIGLVIAGFVGLAVDKALEAFLLIVCGFYIFGVTIWTSKNFKE
jgi:uncharacterized membrane protein (Fun14 family)